MRIVCKHIINVRNALLKHVQRLNCVVLNCGVRPLNSFHLFREQYFLGGAKSGLDDAIEPPSTAPFPSYTIDVFVLKIDLSVTSKYSESRRS